MSDDVLAYEILRDRLNNAIAKHLAALRAEPHGTDATFHDQAVTALIEARQRLDPDNPESIEHATHLLKGL